MCPPNATRGRRVPSNSAFTFVEVMIATLVVAFALGAVMQGNSVVLALSRKAHDVNTATMYTQERVEQIRDAAWPDMMSGSYFTSTYFAKVPSSATGLGGKGNITETVTILPYNSTAVCTPLIVTCVGTGTPTVTQQQSGVSSLLSAQVKISVSWTGTGGNTYTREVSTVISSSNGINTASLPLNWMFPNQAFSSGSGTSSGGTTTTGGDTTGTTTTTTTTTGNNGNGKGQGNVGGKNGKG